MWPPYWTKDDAKTKRVLYFFSKGHFINEDGEAFKVDDYDGFVSFIFEREALTFIDNLTDDYPFLRESVYDEKCTVVCSKDGKPTMVKIKRKTSTRWIVRASVWSGDDDDKYDASFLHSMKEAYDYFDMGVHITPGSLGHAIQMKLHFKEGFP